MPEEFGAGSAPCRSRSAIHPYPENPDLKSRTPFALLTLGLALAMAACSPGDEPGNSAANRARPGPRTITWEAHGE